MFAIFFCPAGPLGGHFHNNFWLFIGSSDLLSLRAARKGFSQQYHDFLLHRAAPRASLPKARQKWTQWPLRSPNLPEKRTLGGPWPFRGKNTTKMDTVAASRPKTCPKWTPWPLRGHKHVENGHLGRFAAKNMSKTDTLAASRPKHTPKRTGRFAAINHKTILLESGYRCFDLNFHLGHCLEWKLIVRIVGSKEKFVLMEFSANVINDRNSARNSQVLVCFLNK